MLEQDIFCEISLTLSQPLCTRVWRILFSVESYGDSRRVFVSAVMWSQSRGKKIRTRQLKYVDKDIFLSSAPRFHPRIIVKTSSTFLEVVYLWVPNKRSVLNKYIPSISK